jgi:uncharacterized membrane protein YciS (DUF1049 family)
MFRNVLIFLLLLGAMVVAVVFAALNQGVVELDLAFFSIETQKSLVFILVFGAGTVFGMLCLSIWALSLMAQRRRLQKSLKLAEGEIRSLRDIPLNDAE